jgi:alpha-tubulin suppressor-like RCC1 family protein
MVERFARKCGLSYGGLSVAAAGVVMAVLSGGATATAGTVQPRVAGGGGATGATARLDRAASGQRDEAGGEAWHWGFFFGDGNGGADMNLSPAAVQLPAPVVQIATSNSTQYALLDNGQVWAWGYGGSGELGDGTQTDSFTTAVQVHFPAGVRIAYLPTDAMPYDTALAVDTKGNAWGWGANAGGSLCLGNNRSYDEPVQLPLTNVTALAGAFRHAVYDAGGTVYSCGANGYGVLGDGTSSSSDVPVRVLGLDGDQVTELVSAWGNAGALLSDGSYYDWGYNAAGQLGDGDEGTSSAVPVEVHLPDSSPVQQAAQGGSEPNNGQTIVQLRDGSVFAWGDDDYSQLGDGRTGVVPTPEQIDPPAGVRYATLASGGYTSYAVTTTGDVYAWGYNGQGEVGNGTTKTATKPVLVDSGIGMISSTAGDVAVADPFLQGR